MARPEVTGSQRCHRCQLELDLAAFEWRPDAKLFRRTCRKCRVASRSKRAQRSERRCTACHVVLPISAFHLNGDGGRKARCRQCDYARKRALATPDQRARRQAYLKVYRRERPERMRELNKKNAAKPQAKARRQEYRRTARHKAIKRESYFRTKTKSLARTLKYQREKPHVAVAAQERRRARLRGLPATMATADWLQILEVHDNRCAYCLRRCAQLELEHIIAVSRGGGTTTDNVVPACRSCNASKHKKPVFEMARLITNDPIV